MTNAMVLTAYCAGTFSTLAFVYAKPWLGFAIAVGSALVLGIATNFS